MHNPLSVPKPTLIATVRTQLHYDGQRETLEKLEKLWKFNWVMVLRTATLPPTREEELAKYLIGRLEYQRYISNEITTIVVLLKGARKASKTKQRAAGKVVTEVPVVVTEVEREEKEGKAWTVKHHSEEKFAGLIEKLGFKERAEAEEEMRDT
ncbi:hypothetical protein RUND412_008417 [Rhizina undulata]